MSCALEQCSLLGEPFVVKCGVRQGGVLSPYLFAIYIDDIIVQLKQSGHGVINDDSDLLVENREIFIPHLYLAPPQGVTLSEFREDV